MLDFKMRTCFLFLSCTIWNEDYESFLKILTFRLNPFIHHSTLVALATLKRLMGKYALFGHLLYPSIQESLVEKMRRHVEFQEDGGNFLFT
jgi:hypothetical protein